MRRAMSDRVFQRLRLWAACSLLALCYCAPASAITISAIVYDAAKDRLVMRVAYRGTNPDHRFSVQWAECQRLDDARSQILGQLIDSQHNDRALQEFTQDVKIPLAGFTCRPAKVTIRTSAGFFISVDVPAAKKSAPLEPVSDARNAP